MSDPSPRRAGAIFGALLFLSALAPRLWVSLAAASEPVWDGHYYDFGARRIAQGFGYSDDRNIAGQLIWHPWCHYPVGYSAFLATFYRLFGSGPSVAATANSLVGAALAVATWGLAREALSETRARAAGAIVAFHPGLILYAALVMSEPLAALLTLMGFWVASTSQESPIERPTSRRVRIVLGSAMLGAAALVRPQALLCAPFFACFGASFRQRVRAGLVACTVALLVVMPWTLRNCRVMDGCALVSTNAGWNLAIGAFPRATGRFETLRSSDGCRDVTGQVQQDRCWFKYGLDQIHGDPLRWLGLIPAKLGFTFDHESFAVEYLHEARPEVWAEPRRLFARSVTTVAHRILLVAAALGSVAFPHLRGGTESITQTALLVVAGLLVVFALNADSPTFWPLAVFVIAAAWIPWPGRPEATPAMLLSVSLLATTILTHAVFFGEDRYHVVVTPILAILAAGALRSPGQHGGVHA